MKSEEKVMDILSKIQEEGIDIKIRDGKVMIHRSVSPTVLAFIKQHREEVIEYFTDLDKFPKPYINTTGDMVIPFGSHPEYHWWRGGQSISETLTKMKASGETVKICSSRKC